MRGAQAESTTRPAGLGQIAHDITIRDHQPGSNFESESSRDKIGALPYHVYIERPRDPSPEGRARLAAGISQRYGLPKETLEQHLASGRLRVKSNVDPHKAEKFRRDLEALGAVVTVVDAATGQPAQLPSSRPKYESGLAAAMAAPSPDLSLGALGSIDPTGSTPPPLTFASLDGEDLGAPEPPPLSAPSAPATAPIPLALEEDDDETTRQVAAAEKAPAPPHDPFAPPEDSLAPLDLDTPPPEPRRGTLSAAEPAEEPATSSSLASLPSMPAMPGAGALPRHSGGVSAVGGPLAARFAGKPVSRLFAGVAFALALGFLPAWLYAGAAEEPKLAAIVQDVREYQSGEITLAQWENDLPRYRREAVERLASASRRVAFMTGLLWLAGAGGAAWLWFKKLA